MKTTYSLAFLAYIIEIIFNFNIDVYFITYIILEIKRVNIRQDSFFDDIIYYV
jgi:hypothetical protein